MNNPDSNDTRKAALAPSHWREALSDERVAHMVKESYKGLSRALQIRLREHAVLYGHWTFLRILWQADGLTQRQLSERAGVAEPTAFSALQVMEKQGYVTRQKMPDNRKQVRIFLTRKGTALRDVLVPMAEEVNRFALAGIPADDVAATRRTLLAVLENLAGDDFLPASRKSRAAPSEPS